MVDWTRRSSPLSFASEKVWMVRPVRCFHVLMWEQFPSAWVSVIVDSTSTSSSEELTVPPWYVAMPVVGFVLRAVCLVRAMRLRGYLFTFVQKNSLSFSGAPRLLYGLIPRVSRRIQSAARGRALLYQHVRSKRLITDAHRGTMGADYGSKHPLLQPFLYIIAQ